MPEDAPFLIVEDLITGYGTKQILYGINLTVARGEIVAIIGHNGCGKSTFLKAAFGMLPLWSGRLFYWGKEFQKMNQLDLIRMGVVYMPQGNRVFTELTVRENLKLATLPLRDRKIFESGIEQVLTLFPSFKSRLNEKAGVLSGGEKQMLAVASVLILSPRAILLDEPSLGLSPPLTTEAFRRIASACHDLHVAALIVEQKVREVLKIAQRVYVFRNGRVSFAGYSEELRDETKLQSVYL